MHCRILQVYCVMRAYIGNTEQRVGSRYTRVPAVWKTLSAARGTAESGRDNAHRCARRQYSKQQLRVLEAGGYSPRSTPVGESCV